jgi:hypothetical protein
VAARKLYALVLALVLASALASWSWINNTI